MDKRLVSTLLRICQSHENRFQPGQALSQFCADYNVGRHQGASLVFTAADKEEIARILQGEEGVDSRTTTPDAWDSLNRAQSLSLAFDEKLSGRTVGAGRIRIKTLADRPLGVLGHCWTFPVRTDMGLDVERVLAQTIGHDALLIVENLQTFDEIHRVSPLVMQGLAAENPLVVYRGDTQGGARVDAMHRLITQTSLPVYAFVDYDPAGVVIAAGLPRLHQLLIPPLAELSHLIQARGIARRYLEQVAAARHVLQRIENDERLAPLWKIIHAAGKGLPQEYFHGENP